MLAWAHNHTANAPVQENVIDATCTEMGSYDEVIYCSICSEELSRVQKTINALGHDLVRHDAQAATCTVVGWDTYDTCSRCDYTTYEEIPALGHDLIHHGTQAPTCTETGWEAYDTCSRCDYTTYVEMPVLGHTPGEPMRENEVPATYEAAGSYDEVVYCTVCGAELSRETNTVDWLPPAITAQPESVTANVGTVAVFTITASGADSYRWQWSSDKGKTWNNSTSATTGYNTDTLQVNAAKKRNGYMYRCQVTNSAGTVTSDAVTLTVNSMPVITVQPEDVSANEGDTAVFTVTATGAETYQWQWSSDKGKTWNNSTSATTGYNTDTLQVSAAAKRNGYQYRCKVINSAGTVTSDAATLTVKALPVITAQPEDVSANEGDTVVFTVTATGAESYQWQWSSDKGKTWNNSTSATTGYNTDTLQVNAAKKRNGYMYRCQVTNSAGTVTSDTATLTVGSKPTILTQPVDVTVAAGQKATFTVEATGATGYQWQYLKPGETTWTNVKTNGTSATYSLTTAARHNGYTYRCQVTNSAGTVTSDTATLTVGSKPTIITQPVDVTVAAGQKATFTVEATGATSYQWQYLKPGETTWTNVKTNGTSATYTLTTAARHNGYTYRCKVTNDVGSVYSSTAALTVE